MKFRTEVDIRPFDRKTGYASRILAIGSCFADKMAAALARAKFRITANPAGVLFNPASIEQTIRMFGDGTTVSAAELQYAEGRFFDYRFHGSLSGPSAEDTAAKINGALSAGHRALCESDTVIITFGTAWIYELNATGCTVANCHKQPASLFTRRRLSVGQITDSFSALLGTLLKDKTVIFTVSPVRHSGDGADENFTSKATLKLAVAELVEKFENALYFPAYEILNDDLRDYRFYADDLVHPSAQAIEYIREKFFAAALEPKALAILPQIEKVTAAAAHRPLDPRSEQFRAFCRASLQTALKLENETEGLDLAAEREYFTSMLQ